VAQEKIDELRALQDSPEGDLGVRETLLDPHGFLFGTRKDPPQDQNIPHWPH